MENERDLQETSAEETAAEEMTAAPVSDPDPEKPKKKVNIARRKRLKYGGLATAITCVVVAIVVLVNVLVSRLTERFPLLLALPAAI